MSLTFIFKLNKLWS